MQILATQTTLEFSPTQAPASNTTQARPNQFMSSLAPSSGYNSTQFKINAQDKSFGQPMQAPSEMITGNFGCLVSSLKFF